MERLEKLEKAKARAEKLVERAQEGVDEALQALRECGVDPDRDMHPQIEELEQEAQRSKAFADKLLEELSAQLEGH